MSDGRAEEAGECRGCAEKVPAGALFCPSCGTPRNVHEGDALVGTVLADRYLVLTQLGAGASGTIYRVEHITLGRRFALKVLHGSLCGDELSLERFRREATTVGEIENEHIVSVSDFGRLPDGRLFMVMELLEGESLAALLSRDGPLGLDVILDITLQLTDALGEAHARGYVHRDLRPANIFLLRQRGRSNFVKLLDFGLSKLMSPDGAAEATSLGRTFGDARYMSPEQAAGQAASPRADLYALGVIMFEMLVGAPPFDGTDPREILQRQLATAPEPPSLRRTGVPSFLEEAVLRSLAKQPQRRFATAAELALALGPVGAVTDEADSDGTGRRPVAEGADTSSPALHTLPMAESGSAAGSTAVIRAALAPSLTGRWFAEGEQLAEAGESAEAQGQSRLASKAAPARPAKPRKPKRSGTDKVPSLDASLARGPRGEGSRPMTSATFAGASQWRPPQQSRALWGIAGLATVGALGLLLWSRWGGLDGRQSAHELPTAARAAVAATPTPTPNAPEIPMPPAVRAVGEGLPQPVSGQAHPIASGTLPAPRKSGQVASQVDRASSSSGSRLSPRVAEIPLAKLPPEPSPSSAASAEPSASASAEPEPEPEPEKLSESKQQVMLGQTALADRENQRALGLFTHARALDPNNVEAIVGMGQVALALGSAKDAAVHLAEAARRRPSSGRIQRLLASALRESGDSEAAEAARKRALQLDRVP